MKVYKFKKEDSEKKKKMPNVHLKKHIVKGIILLCFILLTGSLIYLYNTNVTVRNWTDKNIFKKEITNENINIIEIDSENMPYIYAYDKYIVTLEKNNLKAYNYTGEKEMDIEVSVSKPIFSSNNRFLAVAESYGKKLYLISSQGIVWEQNIEGEISRINVNKNGYVSIAITQTSHKTIVKTYNPEGKELFTIYISTTYGVDVDLSNDNKELAIAEINSSRYRDTK